MQIHLINLDRAGNRLAEFRALNGYLSDVSRFPAIDGRQVKRGELVKRGIIDPALDYTDGAIGNLLSHVALWELAVQNDAPIVICEDDAIFNRHFAQDAPGIVAAAGPDWHVIFWGWNFDAPALFELLPGVSPVVAQFDQAQMRDGIDAFQAAVISPHCFPLLAAFGSVCYSVSPAGARRLLELIPPVSNRRVPVPVINRAYSNKDLGIALIEILPRINAFASFPPLVITRNDHTTSQVRPAPAAAPPGNASDPNGDKAMPQPNPAPSDPVVATGAGKIRGAFVDGVYAFKGVPYGAPTGGANRFMPPQPPEKWAGVRDALAYRGHAPQLPGRPERRPELRTILGPADTTPEGEDCLTLNVWTPGTGGGARRPVMVWLHGGAFAYGSGNRAVTEGANLARRGDVVVVSVNHRLNIFGFLHLADLGGERYAQSGNAGVLDLVAALEWVRDNIEGFGGDPRNVTIFGESGGGGKVSVLLAMPAARGLFHRAVIQSGATIRVSTRERAAALAEAALKHLGIGSGDIGRVHEVPADKLAAAIAPASRAVGRPKLPLLDRYDFGPVVDGADLPAQPFDPAAPVIADDIPLLIGGTREESGFFLADDDEVWNRQVTEASLRRRIGAVAGAEVDRVLDLYRTLRPRASREDLLIAALTGSSFWIRTVLLAERKAARRAAPVYMYSLDWRSPACDGRLQAHHAMDLPFVFDTTPVPDTTKGAPDAGELAACMSATWAAFARTGNPENPALPDWPAYTAEERATMVFDRECRVANDPDGAARPLWERIATRT